MNESSQAKLSPSYDRTLSPEKRLADFLGKYFIGLNGAIVPNDRHKQEIVDYVSDELLDIPQPQTQSVSGGDVDAFEKTISSHYISHNPLLKQMKKDDWIIKQVGRDSRYMLVWCGHWTLDLLKKYIQPTKDSREVKE